MKKLFESPQIPHEQPEDDDRLLHLDYKNILETLPDDLPDDKRQHILGLLEELKATLHRDIDEPPLSPEDFWKSEKIFDYYEQGRKMFRPVNRKIVQDVMRHWVADSDAVIVEIGSGTGEMAKLLPDELKDKVIQTEKTEKFSRINRANNPEARLAGADVYHLPLADGSADVVTGFSMFDTLHDASGAAAEINRVLKEEGKFIHFLDLVHNDDTIFHDLEKEGKVVFPNSSYDWPVLNINNDFGEYSFCTASRAEIEAALGKIADKEVVADVEKYLKNPFREYMKMRDLSGFGKIIKAIMELNGQGVLFPPLNPVIYFQQKLQKIFSEAGFDLLQNGTTSGIGYVFKKDESVKDLPPAFNFIRNKVGRIVRSKEKNIGADVVRIESFLHVVVAQKKNK